MTEPVPQTRIRLAPARRYAVNTDNGQFTTLQWGSQDLVTKDDRQHRICLYSSNYSTNRTICGRAMFGVGEPGWSKGGGCSDGDAFPCEECWEVAQPRVTGMFKELFRGWLP